jgi:phosphatidylinositol-3-phosphatase
VDDPLGPDPAGDPRRDALQPAPESSTEDEREDQFAMPSPWAAAFAVLALLAFGVGLGRYLHPASSNTPVVLAASASQTSSAGPTTTTAAASKPEAAPPRIQTGATVEEPPSQAGASAPEAAGSQGAEAGSHSEAPAKSEAKPKQGKQKDAGKGGSPKGGSPKGDSKGTGPQGAGFGGKTGSSALPPIKHVFVIVLGDQGYEGLFGSGASAPYLATTLRQQGELIGDYYGVASGELANEIALIGGQGPTSQTASNCPVYENLSPGRQGPEGQALGSGCVYPIATLTVGDQLVAAGDTWKAYVQGLDEVAGAGSQAKCPNPALGAADPNSLPTSGDPYVTWRDPFLYFHSVIESASCARENVGVNQLATDLKSAASTPSLSYIAPDPCDDGASEPCAAGAPAGPAAAEGFLRDVVPEIESSAAYKQGGLIAITSDEAPQSGVGADTSGCCATPAYPNLPASTPTSSTAGQPSGGGRVGLLLISKYVKPGSSDVTGQYNHFSLLASVEALFKLKTLGYAGNIQLPTFEKAVYDG